MNHSAPLSCLGRGPQLAQIARLLERAAEGHGQALFVHGEPGIGKTALVSEAARYAERLGMQVLTGSAEEIEQCLPFSAISDCLGVGSASCDPRRVRVAHIMSGEGRLGAAGARAGASRVDFATVEAFLALVDELCAAGPVLMALDDLHWADTASLLILRRLQRAMGQLPLMLIGSYRTVPKVAALTELCAGREGVRPAALRLGPLEPSAVDELVTELVGAPPGTALAVRVAEAAGNPLYITELITALSRESAITVRGGTAEAVGSAAPASLADAIVHRLSFLSADALHLLRVASVIGSRFAVALLSEVLGRSVGEVLALVMEAVEAGVLAEAGEQLAFRHDLIRRVLHDAQPRSVQVTVHQEAGRALAEAGAPVERIAEHLLDSRSACSAWTVDWTARSAGRLTARAPQLAVDLLERSLAIAGREDPLAGQLTLHLAVALLCSGRTREAEEHARQALAHHAEPALEPTLHWILAQSLFLRGRPDLAEHAAESACASPVVPPAEAARFHAFASVCLVSMGRTDEAEAVAESLRPPGGEAEDEAATAFALQTLATVRILDFRYGQAVDLLQEALRIVPETPQSCHRLALQLSLANTHLELDQAGAAHTALDAGRRLAEQRGGFFLPWYHLSEALLLFHTGRWDDAEAEIQAGREPGEHFGMSRALRGLAALIALHQGRGPEAAGHLAAARADTGSETIAPFYAHLTLRAEALDHEARGAVGQAYGVLAAALDAAGEPGGRRSLLSSLAADVVRLALASGDKAAALRAASQMETIARTSGAPHHVADALRCNGLVQGRPETLLEAAERYQEAVRPLGQAQSFCEAAELVARAGRLEEARRLLRLGMARYTTLGAAWDIRRDEARLRAVGIRRGHHGEPRACAGWDSLTATQLTVASYVAQGYSNPEIAARMFVSRRTTQTHVSHILARLGLSSRVELAAAYARRQR
ncbi:helix-turn-helix transcriptional regulator [Streptomyces inhibens]|uniref:helix-turn-helix transcriptional regulator n=1 Tax=Streptomyces inhibens TaxID=2293571 RepID=UPI00402ACDC4